MNKFIIPAIAIAASLGGLVACSAVSSGLAIVQAEAVTINTAVQDLSPALIAVLPASLQVNAKTAVAALNAAEVSLQTTGLSASSAKADALALLTAGDEVVAILPLPPATSLAIQAGLGLATALIEGLPVSVPAALAVGAGSAHVVPGPVPVPLS